MSSSSRSSSHEPQHNLGLHPTDLDTHHITKPSQHPPRRSHTYDQQSLVYAVRSGLAGGIAGCAAKTVVAPLDRIKILFQTSSPEFARYRSIPFGFVPAILDVYRSSGIRGLYRGHLATLLRIFPYAGIKFLAYEQIRAVVIWTPRHETAWRRLLSGSAAGVTTVMLTYPLEVIRVRMAFETRSGDSRIRLSEICSQIYSERPKLLKPDKVGVAPTIAATELVVPRGGLANFYRGFAPTLLGMIPYAGTSFLTHDSVGDWLRDPRIAYYTTEPGARSQDKGSQRSRPVLKHWAELFSGAAAGLFSQTASYPLEVIRRRMQVGGAVGDGHKLRILETGRLIWRERGMRGFFAGLGVGYVKVVPMVAVSFWVYERGKLVLGI